MRIYISGPVTGTPHYALRFAAAAHRLHAAGHVPANPTLLPGWRDSRGAMAEADWADAVGLPVRDLEEWL